jgi:hypothetical protein
MGILAKSSTIVAKVAYFISNSSERDLATCNQKRVK